MIILRLKILQASNMLTVRLFFWIFIIPFFHKFLFISDNLHRIKNLNPQPVISTAKKPDCQFSIVSRIISVTYSETTGVDYALFNLMLQCKLILCEAEVNTMLYSNTEYLSIIEISNPVPYYKNLLYAFQNKTVFEIQRLLLICGRNARLMIYLIFSLLYFFHCRL